MSILVFNAVKAVDGVIAVFKDCRKELRHEAKKVCKKVKKVLRSSKGHRVHCKNTPPPTPPPPPTTRTIAVQTSFESLLEPVCHEGEIDMSRHLNSNQSNSYSSARPGRAFGSTGGRTGQYANYGSGSVLPDKPFSQAKKPTTSVSTSTTFPSVKSTSRSNRTGTLPVIDTNSSSFTRHRSLSPLPRRRSTSDGNTKMSSQPHSSTSGSHHHNFTSSPSHTSRSSHRHSSTGGSTHSSKAPLYAPHPPSSQRPSSPSFSLARQRRRESKGTTSSPREFSLRETSRDEPSQLKEVSELTHTLSSTSLRRSASMSSLNIRVERSQSNSLFFEDWLHSENFLGSKRVPQYLRVDIGPATQAEATPVTNTLASPDRRDTKCTADASMLAKESSRAVSPASAIAKFLRSVKDFARSKVKSQGTQTTEGIESILFSGGLVGLMNVGNTCFMNSTLQCLSHTVEMTQLYLHSDSLSLRTSSVGRAYTKLIQEMWPRDNHHPSSSIRSSKALNTREFKNAVSNMWPLYSGTRQHDSEEFLDQLLAELHREWMSGQKSSPNKLLPIPTGSGADCAEEKWRATLRENNSPIARAFMGQTGNTFSCTVCNTATVSYEPFWVLPVPFPRSAHASSYKTVTIPECLDTFFKIEVLDGGNKGLCSTCKKYQRCHLQMVLTQLPPIFVIYLKRFSGHGFRTKLETKVDVPLTIDFTKYASQQIFKGKYSGRKLTYELYAMSNHIGTPSFGHYTAVAKHFATEQWFHYNDSVVTKITNLDLYLKSREPYVLFYRRTLSDE